MNLEAYIRQAALARGIDPDIAVRVAKSEGGLKDPTRQSDFARGGRREPSYGPFQLLVGGGNTGFPEGLGNAALAAGIDPRTPEGALKGIDFALDQARAGGWGPWYGAKAQGITGMEGIGGNPVSLPGKIGGDSMVARDFDPQIAAQTNSPVFGSFAPPDTGIDPAVAQYAFSEDRKNRLAKAGEFFDDAFAVRAPRPGPFPGGPSAEQAGGLMKATGNINKLAQMLLSRRVA